MKRVLLVLFTLAWSVSGHATTLFGIALGQPLHLPECAQRQGDYLPGDRSTCFKLAAGPPNASRLPADGRIIVNVALPDRPDFMSGSDVVVELSAGRAVSVSARTHGAGQDGQDLAALEQLFGSTRPKYQSSSQPYQSYRTIRAHWHLPDHRRVYFNSTEFGKYHGLVRIRTAQAMPHQPAIWD